MYAYFRVLHPHDPPPVVRVEEDAQAEGEVHLLQMVRHTGYRLVAHMVTS